MNELCVLGVEGIDLRWLPDKIEEAPVAQRKTQAAGKRSKLKVLKTHARCAMDLIDDLLNFINLIQPKSRLILYKKRSAATVRSIWLSRSETGPVKLFVERTKK